MQLLNPNGQCEEALKFYAKVLGGEIKMMLPYRGNPAGQQTPPEMLDKIMHARLVTILQKAREAIRQVLEGKVLLTRPAIAHEAQQAFDAVKPTLAVEIADALNKAGLLREDPPR